MDWVGVDGLQLPATIGLLAWEKQVQQPLIFDLALGCDVSAVAAQQDLRLGVDYFAVSQWLANYLSEPVELLETLAERICEQLLAWPNVQAVQIKIRKPWAVPNSSGSWVAITRHRLG